MTRWLLVVAITNGCFSSQSNADCQHLLDKGLASTLLSFALTSSQGKSCAIRGLLVIVNSHDYSCSQSSEHHLGKAAAIHARLHI